MPPALHPRSVTTLSLFTTTLAISFLVVGLPHVMPCPVPAKARADDGTPRRRRRRNPDEQANAEGQEAEAMMRAEETGKIRECPVPKPGGLVGQILGVRQEEARERPVVKVEKFNLNSRRIAREQEDGKG